MTNARKRTKELRAIRKQKAELGKRVSRDVKDAAAELAAKYEDDLRDLAKR